MVSVTKINTGQELLVRPYLDVIRRHCKVMEFANQQKELKAQSSTEIVHWSSTKKKIFGSNEVVT